MLVGAACAVFERRRFFNGMPASPSGPGYPGSANLPGTPSRPGYPGYVNLPGTPSRPGYPGYVNLPGIPSRPGYPGYVNLPGTPSRPGYPSYPGSPSYPGTLELLKKTSDMYLTDTHFVYQYKAHALTGVKTLTGTKIGVRFECKVIVKKQTTLSLEGISVWVKDFKAYKMMNIEVVRPDLPLNDIHVGQEIDMNVDTEIPIHLADLDKVIRDATEKDFSLNLKKSIMTLLKLTPEALETSTTTLTESGILGTCSVLYNTHILKPDTLNVTKIFNTRQCTSRPVVEARRPQMWWDDEQLYNITSEPLTGKLSASVQYGLIKVDTDTQVPWKVDWVRALSTHDAAPMTEKEARLATYVVQEMKWLRDETVDLPTIPNPVKDVFGLHMTLAPLKWIQDKIDSVNVLPHNTRPALEQMYDTIRRNLHKSQQRSPVRAEWGSMCKKTQIKETIKVIAEKFETKTVIDTDNTVEYVPQLKHQLMWCTKEEINTLFDFFYETKNTKPVRFSLMINAMSKLWTLEALEVMKEAMIVNKLTKLEMVNMFSGINTQLYSNKDFVNKIQTMCDLPMLQSKPLVFHTCVLALGSHLYKTYSQLNTVLDLPILPRRGNIHESVDLIKVIQWLKEKLMDRETDLQRSAIVKAMGNSGLHHFWPDLYRIITLRRVVRSSSPVEQVKPMYSDVLRVHSLQALNNMIRLPLVRMITDNKNIVEDIKATMFVVITDPTETATLRMEALRVLMEARPTVLELRLVTEQLRTEPDVHFASGAYSYMQQLADTEVPSYTIRSQKLRDVLRSIPKPTVRLTEWSRVFDFVDKRSKNGMMFKVFTMDESFTLPLPHNLLVSLQTFFSGKTFNQWDFGTWISSWKNLVNDIKSLLKNEQIRRETEEDFLLVDKLRYTLRLVATVEGGFYIKVKNQDIVLVTFEDIRNMFKEQTLSREPRPMFNWFRMFSAPMLHEMVPTMIGLPLYYNRTDDVLVQTKIDGQLKIFTELDVTIDLKLKKQCTTRMGMQLPGKELGTKYVSRINVDLPVFYKFKKLGDLEYRLTTGFQSPKTDKRVVVKTLSKTKHFHLTMLEDEDVEEILPESVIEDETEPIIDLTVLGFMIKRKMNFISSPFLGLCGENTVTVVPTRPESDELFTTEWKFEEPRHTTDGTVFYDTPIKNQLFNYLYFPRIEDQHSLMRKNLKVTRTPLTSYKLLVKLMAEDTWKIRFEGYRTKEMGEMRFMTYLTFVPNRITTVEKTKLCVRGFYDSPHMAPVELTLIPRDMKLAVVVTWGDNCHETKSRDKFMYFQLIGKTAQSAPRIVKRRIEEQKVLCEKSMLECPGCSTTHDHCQRYNTLKNQIYDVDIVGHHGEKLPWWVRKTVAARYWYLRGVHPTMYSKVPLVPHSKHINVRITRVPSFAQPDVMTVKMKYNKTSETFRELTMESLMKVTRPLFLVPETSITADLVNSLFPVVSKIIMPLTHQDKGVCKISEKKLVTFDQSRYEVNTPLFSTCPVVLAADCSGDKEFVITKENRIIKIRIENKVLKYDTLSEVLIDDEHLLNTKVFKHTPRDKVVFTIPKFDINVVVVPGEDIITIWMPRFYERRLCGVCGHFDGNTVNDLMAPDTSVYPVDSTPLELKHLIYKYTIKTDECEINEPTLIKREELYKGCNMELINVRNEMHIKQHRGRECVPYVQQLLRCPVGCKVERSVDVPVNYFCSERTTIRDFIRDPRGHSPNGIFVDNVPMRCIQE